MEKPKNFNNSKTFEKELQDILFELLQDKIKQTLEFAIQTHNANIIKQILDILDLNKF